MAAPELRLDGSIRFWVLLPVAWIALAVGILRLRVAGLLRGEREPVWREQRQDTQILARSRLLRENGRFLTQQGFLMRKHYFNNPETGFFRKTKRKIQPRNPLTDPTMVTEMMKGNIINVLPMILVGGWINWAFSGFVATKVPFPLTLRFKPMLQRGINLPSLDASWVSSASWYFLNVFGLRRMYNIILGEETGRMGSLRAGFSPLGSARRGTRADFARPRAGRDVWARLTSAVGAVDPNKPRWSHAAPAGAAPFPGKRPRAEGHPILHGV